MSNVLILQSHSLYNTHITTSTVMRIYYLEMKTNCLSICLPLLRSIHCPVMIHQLSRIRFLPLLVFKFQRESKKTVKFHLLVKLLSFHQQEVSIILLILSYVGFYIGRGFYWVLKYVIFLEYRHVGSLRPNSTTKPQKTRVLSPKVSRFKTGKTGC